MKHLIQWILVLVAIAAVTDLSGAWTSVQEPPKPEKKMDKPPAKKIQNKNRAARHAALRQTLPTLKLKLSEAITLAEKESGGIAYSAGLEIIEGKPSMQVNLFVNDKFTVVDVNPETKKVTAAAKKTEELQGEDDEGGEEKEDD